MGELRWNPLLNTYTMIASNRQARPDMPHDACPFCPGSGKVPDHYEVICYPNDFPALTLNPESPIDPNSELYLSKENYGICEVVLYSSDHTAKFPDLSLDHIVKLIRVWSDRSLEISKDPKVKYIFIFENRGEEVGVTMPHPHGQIYGYPFLPLKLKVELDACREYYKEEGKNLLLEMVEEERKYKKRIIYENDSFMAFLPYFTDYPYGVFIVSKKLKLFIEDFNENEQKDLAIVLKYVIGGFDSLYDKPFPYMMCMHQAPVNLKEYEDCQDYYNFHIEFYPPLRDHDRIKFYASSEMGAWAATNTRDVEETAVELRIALDKFISKRPNSGRE